MPLIRAACVGLLICCALGSPVAAGEANRPDGTTIIPYRTMRYARVVGQTSWVTCGPAAVATLLTHYLGVEASEDDVLLAIAGEDPRRTERTSNENIPLKLAGYSMLDLKRALDRFGVDSAGYRVDAPRLEAYLKQGGHPVIVHLTEPQLHFAVLIGEAGGRLILGDPSFGERSLSWYELTERYGYSGNLLVPVPTPEQLLAMRHGQAEALRAFVERSVRLRRLGEAI